MITNSACWICNSFFLYLFIVLRYFVICSFCFQGKPSGAVSTFTTGNYPRQPAVASMFVKILNLFFLVELNSDVIRDVSSAKMSDTFAAAQVLLKGTFFVFSLFLVLLVESQGCSMFLLKLLIEQTYYICCQSRYVSYY